MDTSTTDRSASPALEEAFQCFLAKISKPRGPTGLDDDLYAAVPSPIVPSNKEGAVAA